jgi:hypothetical protein
MCREKQPEKTKCSNCPRIVKTGKLKKVIENGEVKFLCFVCQRKQITNPYYISKEQRNISKYNLSDAERRVQHDALMASGMTSQAAWLRVNRTAKYLQNAKKRKNWEFYNKMKQIKQEQKTKEEQKKAFVEGLK